RRRGLGRCHGASPHVTISGTGCLIHATLYQSDTPGIDGAAAGSRNGVPQPRRDDLGGRELEAGRDHTDHRNAEESARESEAEGIDAEFFQTLYDQSKNIAAFS